MEDCVGKICPVCRQEIKVGEMIITCPDCGMPHHENCWNMNGGCSTFGCAQQGTVEKAKPVERCSKCGAELADGQAFCPKCGTPRGAIAKKTCGKCGAELAEGQEFCSKCGQKVGLAVDSNVSAAINNYNGSVQKKSGAKKIVPIIIAVVAVALIAVVFILVKGKSVKEISLSKSSVEMKVGDSQSISYTIAPEKASKVKVKWSSSNESVATVNDNGKITAKGDGSCTITATAGGKTDTVKVTCKSGPDFKSVFDKYCSSTYASVGSDGSYLSIDTNPYDIDEYVASGSIQALRDVNDALGLPDYILDDMGSTTALMGRQSEDFPDLGITVSWSYHPDSGLEVTYKAK